MTRNARHALRVLPRQMACRFRLRFESMLFDASGILKVLGLRLMKGHQSMFVKVKRSGNVAVAAEASMYDVE